MTIFKIIFIFTAIIIFACLVYKFLYTNSRNEGSTPLTVAGHSLMVKIAKTEAEKNQGLSYVKSVGWNEGMLFLLPYPQQPVFWMKDMNFALDFLWIRNNRVVGLNEKIPPPQPNLPDSDIIRIYPDSQVDAVLEVNSGWIEKNGIKTGDTVNINY